MVRGNVLGRWRVRGENRGDGRRVESSRGVNLNEGRVTLATLLTVRRSEAFAGAEQQHVDENGLLKLLVDYQMSSTHKGSQSAAREGTHQRKQGGEGELTNRPRVPPTRRPLLHLPHLQRPFHQLNSPLHTNLPNVPRPPLIKLRPVVRPPLARDGNELRAVAQPKSL